MNRPALQTYLDEEDKSLLAVIQKVENGYIARFERHLTHPVEKVWSALRDYSSVSRKS